MRASHASTLIGALAIATVSFAAPAATTCDTACLRAQIDRYMGALVRHDPAALGNGAAIRYTENGKAAKIGDGLWRSASRLGAYRQYFVDPVSQMAMFMGTVVEGDATALLSLRLRVADGKVVEAEHIVARKGSHPLFAPEAFVTPHPALAAPVAGADRLPRERLIAIADSYFEGIERHDSKVVQAADTCQRIENGVQTTNQPGRASRNCAHSADLLTYIKAVNERRFPIVDPEHGIVVSTFIFDIPGETFRCGRRRRSPPTRRSPRGYASRVFCC